MNVHQLQAAVGAERRKAAAGAEDSMQFGPNYQSENELLDYQ